MVRIKGVVVAALLALAIGLGGCGGPQESTEDPSAKLSAIARLYGEYMATHAGSPPATQGEFRSFLTALPTAQREALGVADIDAGLRSTRDGEPLVILYGSQFGRYSVEGSDVVAFERRGVDGIRQVADAMGVIRELNKNQAEQSLPLDN